MPKDLFSHMGEKMKKIAALFCLITLGSTSALAVIDPDPDMMGMYWDLDADTPCMLPLAAPVNLYIILTNPSMDAIGGFECGFTMEAPVAPYILSATFANPQALDVAPGFQNFIVGFGAPTICTEATLLVTLNVGNFAGVEVYFYLHEATPASIEGSLPVILLTDESLINVGISDLGNGVTAVQSIMECIVATDDTSWDSVKAMYR